MVDTNSFKNQDKLWAISKQASKQAGSNPRGLARCFGQDSMKGEHVVGGNGNGTHGPWDAYSHDDDVSRRIAAAQPQSGTSIFDPVLCELAYRWFCPPAGTVLDPFAGGSVRGIVASKLGRQYIGVDLSERQLEANREQAARLCGEPMPVWIAGDSRQIAAACDGVQVDLVFSCPPYADLEVYSDDPRDISTMGYADFLKVYREIIAACIGMLKQDRFAAFVVGDVRDPKGFYRNLPGDTVAAFQDAGARLYNEAMLVTCLGSLPIRVGRQFAAGRKLGKTHQNVLVFCKGNPQRATEAVGPVEFGDVEGVDSESPIAVGA